MNCDSAFHIEDGQIKVTSMLITNCNTAFAASGDALINASNMSIDQCDIVFKELP